MNFGVCKQCDCLVIPMERLREVCLDQSVVMPQDAAEQGSREANEPNAVRDFMAAVDRIKSTNKDMCNVIKLFGWISIAHVIKWNEELSSISEQLSTVAEKLNKAAK